MALEHCQNCEHTIGKLERAFVFNNNIVCSECYAKLNKINSGERLTSPDLKPSLETVKAAETNKKAESVSLPLRWFYFYIYFLLPFQMFLSLIVLIAAPLTALIIAPYFALILVVFVGLYMRKLWGWYLNWFLLATGALGNILFHPVKDLSEFVAYLLAGLIFTVANVVYFWKRKVLFTKSTQNQP
jgi:hypothetical protein